MKESSSTQSNRGGIWKFALILLLLLAMTCGTIGYVIIQAINAARDIARTPQQVVANLAKAFEPRVSVTTIVRTAIGEIQNKPKLVVMTADVDAEVVKARGTEWGYMYWGTTTVTLRARENRVQYVIPTEKITAKDFYFDNPTRELRIIVPQPMVDPDVVDVQSDPKKIDVKTDLGWAHFDRWSGEPLRQEARHDLRQAVIGAGRHSLLLNQARNNARLQIEKLLSPMAEHLAPGVKISVVFADEQNHP